MSLFQDKWLPVDIFLLVSFFVGKAQLLQNSPHAISPPGKPHCTFTFPPYTIVGYSFLIYNSCTIRRKTSLSNESGLARMLEMEYLFTGVSSWLSRDTCWWWTYKPFPSQRISSHSPLFALSVKSTLHLSPAWWLPCVGIGSCCYLHHSFFSDPLNSFTTRALKCQTLGCAVCHKKSTHFLAQWNLGCTE